MYCVEAYEKISHIPFALRGTVEARAALGRQIDADHQKWDKSPRPLFFSLITPMWNTDPRHLEELILSCMAQSYPFWELILYDDGSLQKKHLEIAEGYSSEDRRIKVFMGSKNAGISEGRNAAVAKEGRGMLLTWVCLCLLQSALSPP